MAVRRVIQWLVRRWVEIGLFSCLVWIVVVGVAGLGVSVDAIQTVISEPEPIPNQPDKITNPLFRPGIPPASAVLIEGPLAVDVSDDGEVLFVGQVEVLGRLHIKDGEMVFSGRPEESARMFFNYFLLHQIVNPYIKKHLGKKK